LTTFSVEAAAVMVKAGELAARHDVAVVPALIFLAAVQLAQQSHSELVSPQIPGIMIANLVERRLPDRASVALLREMTERAYADATREGAPTVSFMHLVRAAAATVRTDWDEALRRAGTSTSALMDQLEVISSDLHIPVKQRSPRYLDSSFDR
jgi:hypothetical protein